MTNTAPITLEQLFRFYRQLPHQAAAIGELEQDLRTNGYEVAMRRDRPWFKTWSTDGKQPDTGPTWFAPARRIVAEFEGCRLTSYLCPAGVWTIGYGRTGPDVKPNIRITQQQADEWLQQDLQRFADGIHRLLPNSSQLGANQQAALISWAFNVGLGAVGDSTLRRRIQAGESYMAVVPQELPKWNKAGNQVLPGLTRRRAAEVQLFTGTAPSAAKAAPSSPFSTLLTPHIALGEFALYQEARRFNQQHQVDTALELAVFLERARERFGGNPVMITSGYRPPAINRSVGGASGSEHLYDAPGVGAVDFYIKGADIRTVQAWCDKEWPYSVGYGAARGFVHLGIRRGRPQLRWDY